MKLIRKAHRAPSAGHTQFQEFKVVRDPAIKKKLRKAAVDQEYVEKAPALIVMCSNTSRSISRYGSRDKESIYPVEEPERISRMDLQNDNKMLR